MLRRYLVHDFVFFRDECPQNAVDESCRRLAAINFSKFNRFVDGDLHWRGAADGEFPDGDPQHGFVNDRHLVERPFGGIFLNQGVKFCAVIDDAVDQREHKLFAVVTQ